MFRKKGKLLIFLCLVIVCNVFSASAEDDDSDSSSSSSSDEEHNKQVAENRLSAQIFAVLDHYKQKDPIGLPGAPIPDPMPIPDIKKSVSLAKLSMTNVKAYGLSKFRLKYIHSDLNGLSVKAGIQVDEMLVIGNYTLSSFFTSSKGPFTVILKNVFTQGNASLAVEIDGKVRTQDIKIDISFADMSMDFQNLGFMGSVFQSVVNSAPNVVFDAIKPFIIGEAYTKIKIEVDTNIEKAQNMISEDHSFPNSISPLDMGVAEVRKKIREIGYDPYKIKDYNHTIGVFAMTMTHTWITGVSSFYRVGNITVSLENGNVTIGMQVGTQQIMGSTQWEVSIGSGIVTRAGQAQFTVQHIKVAFQISQPLDTRKKPQMEDLQLELGNIQVNSFDWI